LISPALNLKLLNPREVTAATEQANHFGQRAALMMKHGTAIGESDREAITESARSRRLAHETI